MNLRPTSRSEPARPHWSHWLLLSGAAGLCCAAWHLVTQARQVRGDLDSDVRTLRDEYARLERERASLKTQLETVQSQLAALQAAPVTPPVPEAALSTDVTPLPDALTPAPPARPRRTAAAAKRSTPATQEPQSDAAPKPRKPRARKAPGNSTT